MSTVAPVSSWTTADNLATRANDVADLIGWDRKRDDLWSGLFGLSTRCRESCSEAHLVQNGHGPLEPEECAAQNLWVRPVALLSICIASSPWCCHPDLEVHVTEREVLKTLDIGKNNSLAVLLDKTHCNTRNRTLWKTPASIKESVEPQVEAMEEEPLDSITSEITRMVWGLFLQTE